MHFSKMAVARQTLMALRSALRGEAAVHGYPAAAKVAPLSAELVAKQAGPWGLLSNEEKKQSKILRNVLIKKFIAMPSARRDQRLPVVMEI